MHDLGLTKRCGCPRRAWTNGCPHTWHYAFQWKRRRYRGALDEVLGRHIDGKTEALKEAEKIFDSVRDGVFGRSAGKLTLRQLGETYLAKYVSPKSGAPLGQGERYRWNLIVNTIVDGKMLGDYIAVEVKKHHVESFVDASRVQRTVTLVDVGGKTYQAKRGGIVSTNRSIGRLKAFYNHRTRVPHRQPSTTHTQAAGVRARATAGAGRRGTASGVDQG